MVSKINLRMFMGIVALMIVFVSGSLAEPMQGRPAIESGYDILAGEDFDYVIIVPTSGHVTALNNFKTWKEQIGFRVKIITLTEIYTNYPTGDNAERIWNFLKDHYLSWGIRYVLLVGDIDQIPMRYLYPDGNPNDGSAYGTDYYYANLDVEDWDIDNDNRWGEFSQDALDTHAEVFVGRIPFNNAATIQSIVDSIVDFERDTGGWKRNALLANGFMDITSASKKTDTAVLAEMLLDDIFNPYGWTTTKLYEQSGLLPSTFASDNDLDQPNFNNACGVNTQGLVNVVMHGNPTGMAGLFWNVDANNNSVMETAPPLNEHLYSWVSQTGHIAANPTSGIVFLCGCSTGVVFGDDPNFATSQLRSRYLVTVPLNGTMLKEYMENGAPVVIGSTAGADYASLWDEITDDSMQTLNYLFLRNLIANDMRAGDAFYAAQEESSQKYGFLRGVRDFNFYGDPSLLLKGIEDRPGGQDVLVTESSYKTFAADYDDNGDMYVGVLVDNPSGTSSNITIYRSTDHGESWSAWTFVNGETEIIMDLGLLVGRHSEYDHRLLVIYSTEMGRVVSVGIDLSDPDNRNSSQIADHGILAKNISVARDPQPMPAAYDVFAAWEYEDNGEYYITLYTSVDNGSSWSRLLTDTPYLMPSVDIGPEGNIYLAAMWDNDANDVGVFQSSDRGVNWSLFKVLTLGYGAQMHTAPDVAVSTDPNFPAVWVAYDFHYQDPVWGSSIDLNFAYSPDAGTTWQTGKVLSADVGVDEWIPDLAGYRSAPNRWVNLAYNMDAFSSTDYPRQIVWRYTSGGLPTHWSARRITNDYTGVAPYAIGPLVIYSPGASVSGSGVVYGGQGKQFIYFSAPWLPTTSFATPTDLSLNAIRFQATDANPLHSAANQGSQPASPEDLPQVWQALGEIPGASSVTGLVEGADGALYAAAVVDTADGHEGRVFRSDDHGQTWSPRSTLPESWSVTSMLRLSTGDLLAAGMALDLTDPGNPQPHGMIYRSTDNALGWETVLDLPSSAVYRLYASSNGDLYAGTGWQGLLLRSIDGGTNWENIAEFGENAVVQTILHTSKGGLWVGLEASNVGSLIYSSTTGGDNWNPVAGLEGVQSVNDLIEAGGSLYAATETESGGSIYRAILEGSSWSPMPDISPVVKAFERLYLDRNGQLFATANQGKGPSGTLVFRLTLGGEGWQPYHGWIDLASVVYELLGMEDGLYAATGHIYGNVYRVLPKDWYWVFLPHMVR
jgi:photosystem II stability/assembly factor-like uncharacterized protein